MIDTEQIDYSLLDRPEILMSLFHPRPEWGESEIYKDAADILIPVEGDILIGARFHMAAETEPNILFFHGNGEIVADYDQMGPLYNQMAINFLPVDYRGYGRSTGKPSVTAMMRDCHRIFAFVEKWLMERRCSGPLVVMGRSLGSASALELAVSYKNRIRGLILESGFAYAGPLLRLLGVDINALGFEEKDGFRNVDKIRSFDKSTLMSLYKLLKKGYLNEMRGIISTGKESNVYHGLLGKKEVAIKIYSIETSDFKTMDRYIKGDHRFHGWRNRRQLIYCWVQKEFQNLSKVYRKINCPVPIAVEKNILVMSFIGKNGIPAPRMKDLPPDDPEGYLEKILKYIREMYSLGLIHGDLSEYNVLNWKQPYLIDFSMGVLLDHPLAEELLQRDIRNILNYFRKFGIEKDEEETLKSIKK